ncbi:hypothetical protein [Methylobacterium nonmethylotrophicum]|uniref:Uncharacterized protein n=1 Tax=Methylobacterium nonmethylotrophicum TaxID=1141884 RepID=A0A4Z0NF73_9HYPH|nr:hypothetical protein [Methylobacterium nonmethylotrophicum]TGD94595.1 hypothetical protein EU555_32090 [Methylobacterium nonmethylotrophicum]
MLAAPLPGPVLHPAFVHLALLKRPRNPTEQNRLTQFVRSVRDLEFVYGPFRVDDAEARNEVAAILQRKELAPVAGPLQDLVTRWADARVSEDGNARWWMFLDLPELIDAYAIEAGLTEDWRDLLARVVYGAILAYGPVGAALPNPPDDVGSRIDVIPGRGRRRRVIDEDGGEGAPPVPPPGGRR